MACSRAGGCLPEEEPDMLEPPDPKPSEPSFTGYPDLASRLLAGSVTAANDELFAERENLIRPEPPTHAVHAFGHKGKIYDGWETRRRRKPGSDWAIVRLGAAGIVHGVVVDTAFFRGNYPPEVSVEATSAEGYPSVDELLAQPWETIVERGPAGGDTRNAYPVTDLRRWTHVRLTIYPDGGVARLRVHGEVVPDPRFLTGTVDLVALENGGRLVECSDAFYSSPLNLILPGRARTMGEGWENARRRAPGNDYATFALGARGVIRHVEVDTSCFVGNAPGWARLTAVDARGGSLDDSGGWTDVVSKTPVRPDTRHRYLASADGPVSHVRLDVYPDGGLSRLRVHGEVPPDVLLDVRRRWWESLPEHHRKLVAGG
jgi:allantoicase